MAHLITKSDNVVLTKLPAWHGLGTVVEEAPSVQGALQIAGLDWTVRKDPIYAQDKARDSFRAIQGTVAAVRSDTEEVLGIVGDGYEVLQNQDLAQMIDGMAQEGVTARVESAGSLRAGRNVWFLIKAGAIVLGKVDEVALYHLFSNAHDGSAAFQIMPTSVRVVCNNTLTAATSEAKRRIAVRHTASLQERVKEAVTAMRKSGEQIAAFGDAVQHLARVRVATSGVQEFFKVVFERSYGTIPSGTDKAEKARRARAEARVAEWFANLESPLNTGTGTEGSMWHALNAVTQWADHSRSVRETGATTGQKDARTFSNLLGTSADFKAQAFKTALELVPA